MQLFRRTRGAEAREAPVSRPCNSHGVEACVAHVTRPCRWRGVGACIAHVTMFVHDAWKIKSRHAEDSVHGRAELNMLKMELLVELSWAY
ncbi:hypothetical protein L195_g016885 [Trifolium pratense]|uniref:Uncharacterized protein n=1 Tax=Trifolium pratense TaxID=57577 RepID=A0A2K3MSH8_TRIPR|nr:hypothetical protein L195_g016885 [Trifolium pratense]